MKFSKKNIIGLSLILISLILGVIAYFTLSNEVITQFAINGGYNTTSKLIAIIIPTLLSAFGGMIVLIKDESSIPKGVLLSVVGYLVIIFELIMNK